MEWRPRLVLEELLGHDLRAWFSQKWWGAALRRPPLVPRSRLEEAAREGRQLGWLPLPVLGEMKSGVFLSAPPKSAVPATPQTTTTAATPIKQTTL